MQNQRVLGPLPGTSYFVYDNFNKLDHFANEVVDPFSKTGLFFGPLTGLQPFLQSCGNRINSLEIDFSSISTPNSISIEDFKTISENCPLLECLSFSRFHLDQVSISPTFYKQLYCRFCAAFLIYHLALYFFCQKNFCKRVAHKMLVKLTTSRQIRFYRQK